VISKLYEHAGARMPLVVQGAQPEIAGAQTDWHLDNRPAHGILIGMTGHMNVIGVVKFPNELERAGANTT
jgi:hypothetical protein